MLTRRQFLARAGCSLVAAALPPAAAGEAPEEARFVKEAAYYRRAEGDIVECLLCPHRCRVAPLERGTCGNRENRGGTYYTLVHSRCATWHVDPIEKKPFFHVLPASKSFSLSTAGCNMACRFCQNWEISQFRPEQVRSIYLPPEKVVALARENACATIAGTYGEPVVFFEYLRDIALAARRGADDIWPVMVTNGFICEEPLAELADLLPAVKIDLKAFTDKFYREVCRGALEPVRRALTLLTRRGVWIEIVVLIVPTLNDSPEETRQMCRWIAGELGPQVPTHFTRFHPAYLLTSLPKTPTETLERCYEIAREEGLLFPYIGNVPGHKGEHTYCPGCGEVLIRRVGFVVLESNLKGGACPYCGREIPGLWTREPA